jgi:hypothetical protein
MNEKSNQARAPDEEKKVALGWLRNVLGSIVETAPLSPWIKRKTASMIRRLPDWLMASWANTFRIDYMNGYRAYPDMAEKVRSETGRQLTQHYLESRDAVPVANTLQQLVCRVAQLRESCRLTVDKETVERQACALALASCTQEGMEFAESAKHILSDLQKPNHLLVDYHLALDLGNKPKLEILDAALAGGRYGKWVAERLTEVKRWLGLEPPRFHIRYGERTPQWDLLWKRIFTGGENGQ